MTSLWKDGSWVGSARILTPKVGAEVHSAGVMTYVQGSLLGRDRRMDIADGIAGLRVPATAERPLDVRTCVVETPG